MFIKRHIPQNIKPAHFLYFEPVLNVELPEPSLSVCNWAVLFKNGIILTKIGVEKQSLLYDRRLQEVGGYFLIFKMLLLSWYRRQFRVIKKQRKPLVSVINEWSNNYFHWFTEVMPKINFLKTQIPDFTVLIPEGKLSGYQVDSLKLMTVDVETFQGAALVEQLYLPSRQAPFPAHYNPAIIQSLSKEIKNSVDLSFNAGSLVYVTRRNAQIRKISNEDEVIDVLIAAGFSVVDFENFSLSQQVSIAHNARVIVSIHGAGLTNIMFCEKGASILELSLENQTLDKCYFTLADACALKYYYQFCQSASNSDDYHSSDIVVDVSLLKQNISLVTGKKDV